MASTSSTFKYLNGKVCNQNQCFLNPQPTAAVWDCGHFLACNSKFIAVPWCTLGSCAVLNINEPCKIPSMPPIVQGHSSAVIDVEFHPFDDHLLFTGSEDTTIKGWRIPENGIEERISEPVVTLAGHERKAGTIAWHPSAENVLASTSPDATLKLWDVTKSTAASSIRCTEVLTSLSWNLEGNMICASSKDRHLQLIDIRKGDIATSVDAHPSSKIQRSVWAKKKGKIVSVGFNRQQQRQMMVWDPRVMDKPLQTLEVDHGSAVMTPLLDDDTGLIFVAGRGDSSVRVFHLWEGHDTACTYVNQFAFADGQRGFAFSPKSKLDVSGVEVARLYRLGQKVISHASFKVPRKTADSQFQKDLFPPTFANIPAMHADSFFAGQDSTPKLMALDGLFSGEGCTVVANSQQRVARRLSVKNTGHADVASKDMATELKEEKVAADAKLVDEPVEKKDGEEASPVKFSDADMKKQRELVASLKSQLIEAETLLREMES